MRIHGIWLCIADINEGGKEFTVSKQGKDENQSAVVVTTERRQMEMECDGLDNKRTKGGTSWLISFLR